MHWMACGKEGTAAEGGEGGEKRGGEVPLLSSSLLLLLAPIFE